MLFFLSNFILWLVGAVGILKTILILLSLPQNLFGAGMGIVFLILIRNFGRKGVIELFATSAFALFSIRELVVALSFADFGFFALCLCAFHASHIMHFQEIKRLAEAALAKIKAEGK